MLHRITFMNGSYCEWYDAAHDQAGSSLLGQKLTDCESLSPFSAPAYVAAMATADAIFRDPMYAWSSTQNYPVVYESTRF